MDLALPLNPASRSEANPIAERLRLVLETQPGQVPFLREFGCDLESLVGAVASPARLTEARMRILGAIQRWLPDLTVVACEVGFEPRAVAELDRAVPTAESAMAAPALPTGLRIHVALKGPDGPVRLDATLFT